MSSTIISDFANSPIITGVIGRAEQNITPALDIDAFYSAVFDLNTATDFGLDIWGLIVGVTREIPRDATPTYLGFDALPGFDQQPFGA